MLDHSVDYMLKLTNADIDANNQIINGSFTTTTTWTNLPFADYGTFVISASRDFCMQIWKPKFKAYVFVRVGKTGSWESWVRLGCQRGTTAQRPIDGLTNGTNFYDTTIGKPIWNNAGVWKDATGTTV